MSIFSKQRPSIEKMANKLYKRYLKAGPEMQKWFREIDVRLLMSGHCSLGTEVRTEFKLWDYPWEKQIVNGVDVSPEHPDAVSQRVIKEVWIKVQNDQHTSTSSNA